MKKYTLHHLMVEITRKCNKQCPHCMRGEAQNLTISEELIDKLINEVEDVLSVTAGSGETLLEIEQLQYLIQKIIESHWKTRYIETTTNGTVCDGRIIDSFERFCCSNDGRVALLRISNDQFHNAEEYTRAFEYYISLVDEANARIHKCYPNSNIYLRYVLDKAGELPHLDYEGRAVEHIDGGGHQYVLGKNVAYPELHPHRIKIVGNEIPCAMYLAANGNVCFDEGNSYEHIDSLAIGNMFKNHMTCIINKHNDRCMLLCSETETLKMGDYCNHEKDIPTGSIPYFKLYTLMCRRMLELRYKAKELFPAIPAQEIIRGLPFPSEDEAANTVLAMYSKCPEYTPNMINNIQKYIDQKEKLGIYLGAASGVVLRNMRHNGQKSELWKYFADGKDLLLLPEFEHFRELSQQYAKRKMPNKWNFVCESKFGVVNYQPDTTAVASREFIDRTIQSLESEQKEA